MLFYFVFLSLRAFFFLPSLSTCFNNVPSILKLQAMHACGKLNKHLTTDQWKQIENCIKLLAPFPGAQEYTERDKNVNLAFVPFIMTALKRHLDKIVDSNIEMETVKDGARLLAKDFYSRYFGVVVNKIYPSFPLDTCRRAPCWWLCVTLPPSTLKTLARVTTAERRSCWSRA